MSEASEVPSAAAGRPDAVAAGRRRLDRICGGVAMVGGAALVAVMMVTMASVIGAQFGKPILGDSEIVDQLTGVLVFAFLPYCHLHGGNVMVDFFTRPLPSRVNHALDAFMNLAFAIVAAVITWRLVIGGISAYARDQRTMFLNLPEWVIYAFGSTVSVLWVAVILYVGWEALRRARDDPAGTATDAHTFG
ncbi:MAG: TRAP transporter small permease [Burkholderiaceae bacterium]|nr:TRAP transporter small permease [Burkholderiaceae bacterium]MEB2350625.1 TRAP transporter small permease [Burkholderiaceae bacterium]